MSMKFQEQGWNLGAAQFCRTYESSAIRGEGGLDLGVGLVPPIKSPS